MRGHVALPTCVEVLDMNASASIAPVLAVQPANDGTLRVRLAGDWLERKALPSADAVQQELVKGGVKAMQFDAHELGRWDSALMVRILALHDACAQAGVEFRAESLPGGLAKLVALSQAVPEKKDAARKERVIRQEITSIGQCLQGYSGNNLPGGNGRQRHIRQPCAIAGKCAHKDVVRICHRINAGKIVHARKGLIGIAGWEAYGQRRAGRVAMTGI